MNSVEKVALLVHRDAIVQNVEFNYIKDKLLAYGVLSNEELEDIDCEKTKSAKIRKLLDILPKKEEQETFMTFIRILEQDYDWLAETLSKGSNNRDSPDAAGHLGCNNPLDEILDSHLMTMQQSLIFGGIPFPPTHLVPRSSEINKIRQSLKEMQPGQFVVLHGMAGAGKSVLAAESVRSADILQSNFESNVYWLTIGQTDKDTLLTKMQALCEKLDDSSMPPLSVDQATERLRRLMSDARRTNSLLILDDVWRGEVVRAFDFGCKILLTTRDASVTNVVDGRVILIKVKDGFTQEESMTYLADYLNIAEEELPEQADQIYFESKGSPMVLSLLAPLLKERGVRRTVDPGRWDHYLGKLRDRRYTRLKRNSSPYNYETVHEAIAISFDNLDKETRRALNDFVIFLDDVNIPSNVLETLWQCSRYEMEEKISHLVAKSLIVQYVQEHSSNCSVLYGIHDLLLDYLKSQISLEEQRLAHRQLVDSYLAECRSDFGCLPDDNYIFWFLGYHLYKAEYTELFPQIYLNLYFVSAKLRATGPSDLLNDYRKYQDFISGPNGGNLQRVDDYTRFIRTCGHVLVQCPQLNIVQLALQQPTSSTVYRDAIAMAKLSKDKFYLENCAYGDLQPDGNGNQVLRSTVLTYGHVTAACFTQDGRRILSAVGDGQIRMWEVDSGKEVHRFLGHNGSVHQLSLSSDAKRLVSSSADGSVKVWDLGTVIRKLDETESQATRTPSPRMRQDSWHNMFDVSGRVTNDNSMNTYNGHTNEVLCARFSENGALVVSCGLDHTARIWLSFASMELGILKHEESVSTCCFSECGYFVATGCTDSSIRIWCATRYTCVALFHEQTANPRILFVSFLSDASLLSVSDTEILHFNWKFPSPQNNDTETPSYSVRTIAEASHSCCYQCAAVSGDRQLLSVATSKDNVLLVNIESASQISEFIGHTGSVTCLHFSPGTASSDPSKWLLSGSVDETVKVWNLTNVDQAEERLLSFSSFHAVCPPNDPTSFLIASAGSDNRIEILAGPNCESLLTTEPESGSDQVEQCTLSHRGTMVAWATLSGLIKLMSLEKKEVKVLGHHSDAKLNLLKFSPSDVLIITASEGCIKIWKPNNVVVSIEGPKRGTAECYFLEDEKSVMVCGADGSVRLWNVESGLPSVLFLRDTGLHLTCADLSPDLQWLAQGTTTHGLQIVHIHADLKKPLKQPTRLGQEASPVRVCRFAGQATHLAVGHDSGVIEVFDYTRHMLLSTLTVHQSWVRDLKWCHNSPFYQLVSIGDRIAWWDLSSNRINGPNARNASHFIGSFALPHSSAGLKSSNGIRSSEHRGLGLVQIVEFQGRYASKIFLSTDGRTFATVTDSGIPYILRQLSDQ